MRWNRMIVGALGAQLSLLICLFANDMSHASPLESSPSLKIEVTSPADQSSRPWQGQVGYSITASYNGKSTKFGEIQANDVVMQARFLPDVATASQVQRDLPEALVAISQSNCTGCHDFDSRGAGPSYAAIGARYAGKPSAPATLAKHILEGSSGDWGAGVMPPHPDLAAAQAKAIADWIVGYGNDPATHYYVGNTGSIRMIPVGKPGPRAGIVATAFYTGQLKAGDSRRPGAGRDRIVVMGTSGS
jgi:cytochrome c551/c552